MAEARPSWRGLFWPGLFTLLGLILLVSLGMWQLQRLAWKEDLIARIESRTHAEPVAAPAQGEWAALAGEPAALKALEYSPVRVSGIYLRDREVLVHGNATLGRGGVRMGYFVLTPLAMDGGGIVFVNRGFIPMELRQDADAYAAWRRGDSVAGNETVRVAGLLRAPERRGWFVPSDAPEKGDWFVRDPAVFAASLGLERVAPFTIDTFRDSTREGWPVAGLTVVRFPNNHLDYAFTWFGLAIVLVVVFVLFARRRLRG
ncbi:SURF1 family protein [Pseudochelatococcus contaminans]|uniref:SURF1-like protein n=1 Tax=Pseudochelatococcus contaminans TaxID=1538103 RepID=A0A7W6EGK9_9HYPH|nr:surfeit locus 1 family protein [Pseudochelatococcus contaminans]